MVTGSGVELDPLMVDVAEAAAREGRPPPPRLLYTEQELREVRKLQGIAVAERHETGTDAGEEAAR